MNYETFRKEFNTYQKGVQSNKLMKTKLNSNFDTAYIYTTDYLISVFLYIGTPLANLLTSCN
jgi:hypothetical protein